MNKKIKILVTATLLASFLSVFSNSSQAKKENEPNDTKKTITVINKPFTASIKLIGDIDAKKQTYVAPVFSSKLEKLAEEGSKVKKGAFIAKLESKEEENSLSETELDLGVAENDLIMSEKNASAELVKLSSSISSAKKEVELKELELKKIIDGSTKEELSKLKLNREINKKSLDLAKKNLVQKEVLFNKGILKLKDILEHKLLITEKEKDYNISKAEYKLSLEGSTKETKQIAQLELQKAKNRLRIEEKNQDYQKQQTFLEQEKLKNRISTLKTRLSQIKTRINSTIIKAPTEGTVVLSKIWSMQGLEKVKIGDTVRKGRPFLSIANLDDVVIKTELEEQFIKKVKLGLLCNITSGNIKNKIFSGKVSKIGILAGEKKGSEYVEGASKVFEMNIDLIGKNSVLRPGMSVDIEIILKTLKNQIVIPNIAIYKDNNKNFVLLESGEKKYITVGESNSKESVISKGLATGETIIVEKENENNL